MIETWRNDNASENWIISFKFPKTVTKEEALAKIQKLLDENNGKIPEIWISKEQEQSVSVS